MGWRSRSPSGPAGARPASESSPRPPARSPAAWPRSASRPATASRSSAGRGPSGRSPTSARSAPARWSCPSTTRTRRRSARTCSRTPGAQVICEDAAQAAKIAARPRRAARARARDRDDAGRGRDRARRPARARRRRRTPARSGARGRRARRHGDDRLHVGHDRPAEGLRADAREPALRRPACTRTSSSSRPGVVIFHVPAARSRARPRGAVRGARRRRRRSRSGAATPSGCSTTSHGRGRPTSRRSRGCSRRSTARALAAVEDAAPLRRRIFDGRSPRAPRVRAAERGGALPGTALRPSASPTGSCSGGPRPLRRCARAGPDRRRADRPRDPRVLRRLRRADPRGLRDDRELRGGDAEHTGRHPAGHGRPAASGLRRCDRARRRSTPARPDGIRRLPERSRRDRRDGRGRMAADRRPRQRRRRRLPIDHGPQEGAHHHLERQERDALEHRDGAARVALDLRGRRGRRQPAVPRRAAHARR